MGIKRNEGDHLNRLNRIRSEEKKYHDYCYDNYNLFESGSWLHKPVQTVLDILRQFDDYDTLTVLDLGSGIGRNSIPIAETIKNRHGKVVCVDLLESAILKLIDNSKRYDVQSIIDARLSDIENFKIKQNEYDMIIAVSALEHVSNEETLAQKLTEMKMGTTDHGVNCIIIGSNINEINLLTNEKCDPQFEINLTTVNMLNLLDTQYEGCMVLQDVKTVILI
ncbi:class I SAM-dependent methyltransferase [Paenibacillus sp. strain BS8-2]